MNTISEYINGLLKKGCEIAIPEKLTGVNKKNTPETTTYFFVGKNGRVAYFQKDDLGGFSLSVPVKNKGHSLSMGKGRDITIDGILRVLTPGCETGGVSDVDFKDYITKKAITGQKYIFLKNK